MEKKDEDETVTRNHMGRRTWNKEYFERKARDRGDIDDGIEVEPEKDHPAFQMPRKPLKARTEKIDLEKKLGKSAVVTDATPLNERGGYYCKTCECAIRDSANWLDHINGKKHMRALGHSLRAERSTLSQVKERFKAAKRIKEQPKPKSTYDLDDIVTKRQLEEAEEKREKRKRKKELKRRRNEDEIKQQRVHNPEADMLAAMGLPTGFGT